MAATTGKSGGSPPGILYVTMQPQPSLPVAQFHDWYNNDHGPTRLRLSWVQNGFRYRASDGSSEAPFSPEKPEFMAIYDIDDMDHLTTDEYTRLRKAPDQSQRERDTMKQIKVDRRFYDFIKEWKGPEFRELEKIENASVDNVLVAVLVTLQEGADKEEELTKWYDEEHIGLLSKVAGWRRSRRFVRSYLDLQEGKQKEFLALHEYAPENGLNSEEFKKVTTTPWTKKVHDQILKDRLRRVYNLYYTFGPASRDLTSLADSNTYPVTSTNGLTQSYPAKESSHGYPALDSYITTPDSVQIPYRLEGSSDPNAPVLLLVNSILVNHTIWDAFVPSFLSKTQNKYRVLRFNTRGRSTLPKDSTSPITIETLSKDIITLLDALKIQKASLIGVSLGGATVLNTALTYPERVQAFISCDTNSVAPPSNPKAWGERIEVSEKEGAKASSSTTGTAEPIVGENLAEVTVRRWFVKESYEDANLVPRLEAVKQVVKNNSLDGFKRSVNALYQYDFRDQMGAYKGRGVFLVGGGDGVLPKTMKDMAESLGGGVELKVVEGAGHLPMVEKPDEVAEFTAKFLES